jgi:hypothetical protein
MGVEYISMPLWFFGLFAVFFLVMGAICYFLFKPIKGG